MFNFMSFLIRTLLAGLILVLISVFLYFGFAETPVAQETITETISLS